jgi:hypothetical protein
MRIYFLLLNFLFVIISNFCWAKEASTANLEKLFEIRKTSIFSSFERLLYVNPQTPARQALGLSWADTTAPKSKTHPRMWELGVGVSYVQHPEKSFMGSRLNTAQFSFFGEIALFQAFFMQVHLGWVSLTSEFQTSFLGQQQTIQNSVNRTMLGFQPGIRLPIPIGKLSYIGPLFAYRADIYDSPSNGPKTSYSLLGFSFKVAPIAANILINPEDKIFQLSACYVFQLSK